MRKRERIELAKMEAKQECGDNVIVRDVKAGLFVSKGCRLTVFDLVDELKASDELTYKDRSMYAAKIFLDNIGRCTLKNGQGIRLTPVGTAPRFLEMNALTAASQDALFAVFDLASRDSFELLDSHLTAMHAVQRSAKVTHVMLAHNGLKAAQKREVTPEMIAELQSKHGAMAVVNLRTVRLDQAVTRLTEHTVAKQLESLKADISAAAVKRLGL